MPIYCTGSWGGPGACDVTISYTSVMVSHICILPHRFALGVVAKWSKVLTAVPWPIMVWSTLTLGTYQLRFIPWVFHVIFSFVHFISLYTLGGMCAFRKPLPYNMCLFNLWIANRILIKIFKILYVTKKKEGNIAKQNSVLFGLLVT